MSLSTFWRSREISIWIVQQGIFASYSDDYLQCIQDDRLERGLFDEVDQIGVEQEFRKSTMEREAWCRRELEKLGKR